MKKILSTSALKQLDQATIHNQEISSWELMERAAFAAFQAIIHDYPDILQAEVSILCGKGNNGGDGLAMARMMHGVGIKVQVFLLESVDYSADNQENQNLLDEFQKVTLNEHLVLNTFTYLIDCLFGFGLKKGLDHSWKYIIQQINDFEGTVLSIDMPSGLPVDFPMEEDPIVVEADWVYSFELPKLSFFMPQNGRFVPDFTLIPIQSDQASLEDLSSNYYYLEKEDIRKLLKNRSKFSHKGIYGHACIIGGSLGKIGAVILASRAALRTGCGLVSNLTPTCGHQILQISHPESMVIMDSGEENLRDFQLPQSYQAIAVGIGMGTSEETERGLGLFLQSLDKDQALVLDADALNLLALNPHWLGHLPENSILSPHPKELKRLIGEWDSDEDKLMKAVDFAIAHKVVLLIKGANTAVINSEGTVYFNSSGNPGMATGGTGDVLTGILAGLRAQGYTALEAALIGVYAHGLAGDLASAELSEEGMIAGDLINYLPKVWNMIRQD